MTQCQQKYHSGACEDGRGGPAGGADLLAIEPLKKARAAEAMATGHKAVCSHNGLLANCAAHLILQFLHPVPLHPTSAACIYGEDN